MPNLNFSIDLHCHPNYKAFAKAHASDRQPPLPQSSSTSHRSSLWHYDPPRLKDKLANYFLGVTKFSQNNLTAALYGRLLVMVIGMGSAEKFFLLKQIGHRRHH